MSRIEAVVLGAVQGLTEFLPVSSSGHLVLFQHLFGLKEPELLFDICLHVGTLLAVLVVFYRDLWALIRGLIQLPLNLGGDGRALLLQRSDYRLMAMILVACVPTGILGVFFASLAEQLFSSIALVGCMLGVTGVFLWLTRGRAEQGRGIEAMRWRDALIIGLAQGLAITPGISRSGATIAAALFLGLDRQLAGRFSFLLAIPAILGALVLGLDGDAFNTSLSPGLILAGSATAAVVGYLAITLLLYIIKKGHLHRFAPYCWVVGAAALTLSFF